MSSFQKTAAVPLCAGVVVGIATFFLTESFEQKAKQKNSSSSNSTSAKSLTDLQRTQASRALQLVENANTQAMDEFVGHWLNLHLDDQDYIIGHLSEWYFEDADKYYEFVRDFSLQIFSQDRALGLEIVSAFPRDERMRNLERHVLDQWTTLDQGELFSTFTAGASENLAVNTTHLYQLASIYGTEKIEQFEDYRAWVDSLDREDVGLFDLQRGAYEALSHHCPEEHRPGLYADLMKKAETVDLYRGFPAVIVGEHSKNNPEEATAWLEEMKPGPWKDEALLQFLNVAGELHPRAGADLMNREEFLAEFAVPWEQNGEGRIEVSEKDLPAQFFENFYDNSLGYFLEQAIVIDPDLVFESAEAFYDSSLKEDFQLAAKEAAKEIETGGFTPISTLDGEHKCGPNCTHEHH